MKEDDEDDDSGGLGATRYPCMPSLVGLQQMRNRLHLAHLGKKLMKWTALATGRELRRVAMELDTVYKGLNDEIKDAYILLARCRYFFPDLNALVTEHMEKNAAVVLVSQFKAISAVKVIKYSIQETEFLPYIHLGIGRGGQTITDAKKAWLDLLKHLVMILELRNTFKTVEESHRSATKKMNVLSKIVIPKTKVTTGYINNELEELAREEFFRLKKVLEVKRKRKAAKEEKTVPPAAVIEELPPPPVTPLICIICGKSEDKYLDEFRDQISEILQITKTVDEKGLVSANVKEFIKTAEELKNNLAPSSNLACIPSDVNINQLCNACKERFNKENGAKNIKDQQIQTDEDSNISKEESELFKEESEEIINFKQQEDMTLGVFETEFKEITKIIRVKNEDGTIREEKKVIKIKREIKTPISGTSTPTTSRNVSERMDSSCCQGSNASTKSSPYCGSRTIGIATIKSFEDYENGTVKQVGSKILNRLTSMSASFEPICMSSVTLLSTDLDIEYDECRKKSSHVMIPPLNVKNNRNLLYKPFSSKFQSIANINDDKTYGANKDILSHSETSLLQHVLHNNNDKYKGNKPASLSENNLCKKYKSRTLEGCKSYR